MRFSLVLITLICLTLPVCLNTTTWARDRIGNGDPTVDGDKEVDLLLCIKAKEVKTGEHFIELSVLEQFDWIKECIQVIDEAKERDPGNDKSYAPGPNLT